MKTWLLLSAVALPGCLDLSEDRDVHALVDKELPVPNLEMLDYWRKQEPERVDPKWVAWWELQLVKGVPFSGERFDASVYEFHESHPARPDWGTYVARWYKDHSGRMWRWAVLVSQDRGTWYARKIVHFISVNLTDDSH